MNTRKDRQATPFRLTVIRLSLSGILLGFCLCLTACFTHADVPLRARSIRQWEKQQKIREAELNDSLRKDYQVLLDFTGGYRLMGWEPKQFGHYFREGIQQSLTHYDRKAKNDLLTTTFLTDGVLAGHQSVTHPVDPAPTVSRVPDNILEQFTGDWYGLWQTDTVCHQN